MTTYERGVTFRGVKICTCGQSVEFWKLKPFLMFKILIHTYRQNESGKRRFLHRARGSLRRIPSALAFCARLRVWLSLKLCQDSLSYSSIIITIIIIIINHARVGQARGLAGLPQPPPPFRARCTSASPTCLFLVPFRFLLPIGLPIVSLTPVSLVAYFRIAYFRVTYWPVRP